MIEMERRRSVFRLDSGCAYCMAPAVEQQLAGNLARRHPVALQGCAVGQPQPAR
jgi:hypothetical protein